MKEGKIIEFPIGLDCVNTTELDEHIAEGWKIVAVATDTMNGKVKIQLEKEEV